MKLVMYVKAKLLDNPQRSMQIMNASFTSFVQLKAKLCVVNYSSSNVDQKTHITPYQ